MAISKLILNGETQMDVTSNTNTSNNMLNGVVGTKNDGTSVIGNIASKSSSDLTVSGATVTAPAGYYANAASKAVATTTHPNPSASIASATGVVTASHTQGTGYVTGGTTTGTLNLTTQAATTYNTSTADQTIASNRWLTGTQTIKSVTTSNLTAANIAEGVTVQVGDANNASRITQVTGTHSGATSYTATISGSGNSSYCYVTYNGTKYYYDGSSFTFKAGDTLTIYCRGNYLDINGSPITLSNYSYTYTLPIGDINIVLNYGNITDNGIFITTYLVPSGTLSITSGGDWYVYQYENVFVNSGSAFPPATTITTNPTFSMNSATGVVTASYTGSSSITPTVTSGYISQGTAGIISTTGTSTYTLTTQAAQTITPTETVQYINSYRWLTGSQTIAAISSTYVGTGITRYSASGLTFNGSEAVVAAGYYSSNIGKYMSQGTAIGWFTFTSSTGKYSYGHEVIVAGYMDIGSAMRGQGTFPTQAAQTIYPSTNDQTIYSYRWLTGNQTIKSITTSNLTSENIANGVTVKIGDSDNASRIMQVTGTYTPTSLAFPTAASSTRVGSVIATIYPSTLNQFLNIPTGYNSSSQAYIISCVTTTNLTANNIAAGVTVEVGTPGDTSRITQITGTYDPSFYTIYKQLVTSQYLSSTVASVSEWCNTFTYIPQRYFEGQGFSGDFTFPQVSYIAAGAFARARVWTVGTQPYFSLNFPIATRVGESAFLSNFGIRSIVCPEVSEIGQSAFYECRYLLTISFPKCTTIQSLAFFTCYSLTTASFPSATSIGNSAFYGCSALTTISFPNVTNIGSNAFYNCSKLTTASFPSAISISNYAFSGCSALTTASFPNATSIGIGAFYNCYSLTTASFPNATHIDDNAFYNCSALITANFPSAIHIGSYAFYNCTSLTTASFPSCTSIGGSTFYNCVGLTTVSIPLCTSISTRAFFSCYSLTTASFSVCTSIGSYTFANCYSLTTVNFPACVSISYYAFANCYSLTTASFSACTYIGTYAFASCFNLLSLYLLGSSIPTLSSTSAFYMTPISTYTTSTGGVYGSIFVPASLYSSYLTATNWSVYSSRIVSV